MKKRLLITTTGLAVYAVALSSCPREVVIVGVCALAALIGFLTVINYIKAYENKKH